MDFEQLKHASNLDDHTFRLVMETFGQELWNYAFTLTRNRQDSDDIVQDVFMKCHRSIDSFRGQSAFRTWLFAITRHTAFNLRKSAYWRRVIPSANLFSGNYRGLTSRSAEDVALGNMIEGSIWETLLLLPAKYREILVFDAVYELKQQEIGDLLGLSVGGVKSRLSRARAHMSKLLSQEAPNVQAWTNE